MVWRSLTQEAVASGVHWPVAVLRHCCIPSGPECEGPPLHQLLLARVCKGIPLPSQNVVKGCYDKVRRSLEIWKPQAVSRPPVAMHD